MKLFIIGCQRSGTTLLGMILGNLPDMHMIDQDRLMPPMNDPYDMDEVDRKLESLVEGNCCIKSPQLTYRSDYVAKHFPDAKFVCVFREPKDVVASMMSLRDDQSLWLNIHRMREAAFNNRLYVHPSIHTNCANIYRAKALCVLNWHSDVHFVHYKDLTENPEQTLRNICDSMELTFDKSMMDYHQHNQQSKPIGGNNWKKPIFSNSGKWMNTLSEREGWQVDDIAKPFYEKMLELS